MYLDFDDHRPETPSVPPVISRREGVLLSLVVHLSLTIAYLVMPEQWFAREAVTYPPPAPREDVQFVMMETPKNLTTPPPPRAEASDLDRRATTLEKPPEAENPAPLSRGNTPDKTVGGPPPEAPPGSASTSEVTPPKPEAPALLPETVVQKPAGAEGLAKSLRNLQQYLRNENFSNPNGGQAQQDATINFDAKGVDFGWWLRRFVAQVKGNWYIPQAAMVLKGRVVITLNIHRNGTISDVTIIKSSGHASLDSAAANALRGSNPTVALPAEYPEDKVLFTVTFIYGVER
jgi:TonB family protein